MTWFTMRGMAEENPSSVHRTVSILHTLGTSDTDPASGLGVVEIARRLGREKSQVSRALKALSEAGFVERDPHTLGYRLGWQFFALAANAGDQRLRAVAPAVLRRLVATVKEAAYLSVLCDRSALTVLSESPGRAVEAVPWVGRATPLHVTATGRALLMDRSDEEIRSLLSGADFAGAGPKAPSGLDDLLARTGAARERGFATADEEFETGLVAVGAPVRDFSGRVVAAVNVSAPKYRLASDPGRLGRVVAAAGRQLTAAMCGQPNAPARAAHP